MKKKYIFLMFLLLVSSVFAQNGNKPETTQWQEAHPSVIGLENAMFQVRNQEQVQLLENTMEMIQERQRERLQKLENLVIEADEDGEVVAKGLGQAQLFGRFNMRYQYQYEFNEETGEMSRVRNWYDFAFQGLDEE